MRYFSFIAVLHCLCWSLSLEAGQQRIEAPLVLHKYYSHTLSAREHTNIATVVVTGEVEVDGARRPFTLRSKAPGMFLFSVKEPGGREFKSGRDSSGRLWQEPPAPKDGPQPYGDIHELVFAWFPHARSMAFERLAEAICEADSAAGRAVWSTGIKGHPRTFPRFLFDVETGALVGVGRARFTGSQEVNGFMLPKTVFQSGRAVYRSGSIQFGLEIADSEFTSGKPVGGFLSHVSPASPGLPRSAMLLSKSNALEVVRRPMAAKPSGVRHVTLNRFDPLSGRHAQVDIRGADVSRLDLRDRKADLLHSDFDSHTLWPAELPEGFDPNSIMLLGKDPGLGVRGLHARGITGHGVGIGIIDSPLLTEHREYADRLGLYEEIRVAKGTLAHMHGTAVASIAAGRTCGVAPGAGLYFIASENYAPHPEKRMELDFTAIATSLHRLLDVNRTLPAASKIRVISLSMGWIGAEKGAAEMSQALKRAESENVFVLSTSLRHTHALQFHGLGRDAGADPNNFQSYGPGSWWANTFWAGEVRFKPATRLCAPMDGRTTASPTGPDDYVHYDSSGWSWTVPWIAGLYALACQAAPDVTPRAFWQAALDTGRTIHLDHKAETIPFGAIADPAALVQALVAESPASPQASTKACKSGYKHPVSTTP